MTSTSTPVSIDDVSTVRAALDGIVAAWADNDANAFAEHYSPDATVVLPGGVYHTGREQIRAYMAMAFQGPLRGSRSIDRQEQVRILGDTAVVISVSGYRLAGEAEVPADRLRRATWVLSRQDRTWAVEAYHNCSLG